MKFNYIKEAKQHWRGIKDHQKAYVFQAVWYGEIIPGLPINIKLKIKQILSKMGGEPPGIKYKRIIKILDEILEEYKLKKFDKEKYVERKSLFDFAYPTHNRLGLNLSKEDKEKNEFLKSTLSFVLLDASMNIFTKEGQDFLDTTLRNDLLESEERDKAKVLATI